MRASFRSAAAIAATVAVTVAGAAGCSSSGDKKGPKTVEKGAVVVVDNSAHPDKQVKLKEAEVVKVVGLGDKAAEERLNQAFRAPLEWAMTWSKATLDEEKAKECNGRPSVIQTKVRLGLRGSDVASAGNHISMVPCFDGEGGLPNVPVTVDLKAGKVLTVDDIFEKKTLEGDGPKKLWDALSGPKDDWKDCELDDLERKHFLPGKRDGEPIESPAPAGTLFTSQGLELLWSTTGTSCNNLTFTATYDKLKDLVKPDLLARFQAAASAK